MERLGLEPEARRGRSTVADLGELGLIARLARLVQTSGSDPLRPTARGEIGIGDDAAVWEPAGRWQVLTTDALVEDVHFKPAWTDWRSLGWKALAVNVSDIAAMGAGPRRAFVTLGVRGETALTDLDELYRGLGDLASELDIDIAGGDTVSAPVTFLSISVIGDLDGPGLRRAGGRPGDVLAVTGRLGASAGGLELLRLGITSSQDRVEQELLDVHRRPRPRVAEGLLLAGAGVRCGMDLSDGVLGDAGKLAHASDVGVTLQWDRLPVHPSLQRRFGDRARGLALAGGEDYELLIAGGPELIERAGRALQTAGLTPLSVVGRLTAHEAGRVQVVGADGREVQPDERLWDHWNG